MEESVKFHRHLNQMHPASPFTSENEDNNQMFQDSGTVNYGQWIERKKCGNIQR